MDIVCFLLSDSLGETEYYYYSRIMDEVEEERWIYKTRRELKTTGLPSFPPPKRPSLFVFVVFCQKMKKNVVKNPSKNS